MATNDQVQAKIAAFARQLAEEFGEIDEENLDEYALSWLDAIETRGGCNRRCCHHRAIETKVVGSTCGGRIGLSAVRQAGPLSRAARAGTDRSPRSCHDQRTGVLLSLLPQVFFSRGRQ